MLNGFSAMIEGDPFSGCSMGSASLIYSWQMANWVEEIQFISLKMDFLLFQINRECNILADVLGKRWHFSRLLAFV